MSVNPLAQLVYISHSAVEFSSADLQKLALQAQSNNRKNEVTGFLLYSSGFFIQLLEGPLDIIEALFQKISSDSRHQQIRWLTTHFIEQRMFPDWDMNLIDFLNGDRFDSDRFKRIEHRLESMEDDDRLASELLCEFLTPSHSAQVLITAYDKQVQRVH